MDLARLPIADPFAQVSVESVSAMCMRRSGFEAKDKTTPNIQMNAMVMFVAEVLSAFFRGEFGSLGDHGGAN